MIHSAQKDCIKLQKELGGISSGCRRIPIPRDLAIHLHDILLDLMSHCHLTSPVLLSLISPAMKIDLVCYLSQQGKASHTIPSEVESTD